VQINFFQDHTKVIICPLMSAISYIDENKTFRTYRLPLIEHYGCSKDLHSRLRYAKTMTERLIEKLDANTPLQKGPGSVADLAAFVPPPMPA
jgi:polo-like kinase 1